MGRGTLIAFICAGAAGTTGFLAHSDQAASSYQARSEGVIPPVALMQCHQPEYTDEARLAHLSGVVKLTLTVDDDGLPNDIQVLNPVGLGLDESAIACMRQSRYSPAQKDGKPVPLKINVALTFQDKWEGDWHLGAASFRPAGGCSRPVLVKAGYPAPAGDRRSFAVCLHLIIGKDGVPRAIQVASPQDPRLDKEAVTIVNDWRFRPGTQNRQPVDVPASLTLVHGSGNRVVASGHKPQ